MPDERIVKVAKLLTEYSTEVKAGDRVLISADLAAKDLALEIYKQCLLRDAYPWIRVDLPGRSYTFFKYASERVLNFFPEHELQEVKNADVCIFLRAPLNLRELSAIDPARMSARMRVLKPISEWRVEKTRWCLFYHPVDAFAQEAGMSLEEFEDFVFGSCLVDWGEISASLRKLKELLDATDAVQIVGENTDLRFSIRGRSAVVADGKKNMPDGEVFTSVVEDSVEGSIHFDIPTVYLGRVVEDVRLVFRSGEVTEASARSGEDVLGGILETDEGAKRIGEFGIGFNYRITKPVKSILFDEKIGGTIHLALGRGYKETLSKNDSAIHWDLIKDLRKEGEVYFDGKLVMKNGKWLVI